MMYNNLALASFQVTVFPVGLIIVILIIAGIWLLIRRNRSKGP